MTRPTRVFLPNRNRMMWLCRCSFCPNGLLRKNLFKASTCFQCKRQRHLDYASYVWKWRRSER